MNLLFIDRSTRLETVDDLKTKPRGGMVQSLFRVTDFLALEGHEVIVFSDIKTPGRSKAGVYWVNDLPYINYDALICNRGIGDGYPGINAKKRILWTHDLPHSGFAPKPKLLKAFTTVFMSRYAEKVWRTFYSDIGKSVFIPNGVDEYFTPRIKDLKKIIYFSHPNRGLKRLSFIADCIISRVPDANIVAYSDAKDMYPTDGEMSDYVDVGLEATGTKLKLFKPLPSIELAKEVGTAGLCILPSGYPEICSNSVLQALKSGTPIITTGGMGATPQWVKHGKNGFLTTFMPNDYMVHTVEILRHAVNVLENEKLHRKLIRGAQKTKILSWYQVGEKWNKLLCC